MSEANRSTDSANPHAPASSSLPSGIVGSTIGSLLGDGLRLDEPHQMAGAAVDTASASGAKPTNSRQQRELLLQASQIAEQLQDQFSELDRRENSLNEQLAALDQERRNLRLRVQEFEDQMLDREEAMQAQQAEFASRFATCEKLVGELEQQQHELSAARDTLEEERKRLREELGHDLEVDRAALRQAQAALEAERQQLQQEAERRRNECDSQLEREREALSEQRSELRQSVDEELARERAEFEAERAKWIAQRDSELAELKHEREINEAALTRAQEELLFAKREQETNVERQTADLQANLDAMRAECEEELTRKQAEWEARRETEMAEIERERSLTAQAVGRSEEGLQQQRTEQQTKLREEREEFERECETRRQQLQQERSVLENRLQFQQDHLVKTRQQLEQMQHEWQVEQQKAQTEYARQMELQRLRSNQLDRYRAVLDKREQTENNGQQQLGQWRKTIDAEIRREKARLRQEQDVWEQERKAQQAEVRRQQDLLTLHAQNLEARRDRLDALRSELEETHQRTLEMRMSIEEAWAQLSQSAGEDEARRRVDQAAAALEGHFDQISKEISAQRQELLDAQKQFQQQKDEFRGERRQLTEWIAEREETLRNWEQRMRQESDALDTRSADWRAARDTWQQEKSAAEGVIRSLLSELANAEGAAAARSTALGLQLTTAMPGLFAEDEFRKESA
jgi:chromosome segregation ATPase